MKKNSTIIALILVSIMALSAMTGCAAEPKTTRMEAEYAKITDGRLDMKEGGVVSNDYFVVPNGGFKFEDLLPINVTFDFKADKAADATIRVAVMSANTFGNEFDLSDGDYLFYLNGTKLGVPTKVLDYQGDPTTTIPKEDFTEGTGLVYFLYENVKLNAGDNSFAWKYETGNGAFKLDYVEIETTTNISWTEDHALVDSYDPNNFDFGGFGGK